jgi:hypothetical protein
MRHLVASAFVFAVGVATPAVSAIPGGVDVVCDVPRSGTASFRTAAVGQSDVKFRVWSASTGGTQIGSDYSVAMGNLTVAKRYTDKYDSVLPRKGLRINATIGSDGSPVLLPANGQAWLEVQVGTQILGCDFAATGSPTARRRLQSVAFAQNSNACQTCEALTSPRSYVEAHIPPNVNQGPLPYNTTTRVDFSNEVRDDLGEWDTTAKEFVAQNAGLYLVQAMVEFTDVVDGSVYLSGIYSNNDSETFTTKAVDSVMAPTTGSWPSTQLSSHVSAVLKLAAGKKIWITVDHNNNATPPSLYWRDYDTYLYITRMD